MKRTVEEIKELADDMGLIYDVSTPIRIEVKDANTPNNVQQVEVVGKDFNF